MAQDETKYECPDCHCDMTEQVKSQCRITLDIPMMNKEGKVKRKAPPESVSLQCPNKHWAEYPCPRADRGII